MTNNAESLIETAQRIETLARVDLRNYLGDRILNAMEQAKEERYALVLDYVTVYTGTDTQAATLRDEAAESGEAIYRKKGVWYQVPDEVSPIPFICIADPNPGEERLGAADFALGHEAFPKAKELILAVAPNCEMRSKTARKPDQDGPSTAYTYLSTENPSSKVVTTCLSRSLISIVR